MNGRIKNVRPEMVGLVAVVITWLTGGLTCGFVKYLLNKQLSPESILFVRSLFGIVGAYVISGGKIWSIDKHGRLAGIFIGLSSIAFYRAVQAWEVNPVVVIMSCMPIVSLIMGAFIGRKVHSTVIWGFVILIGGIVWALQPWNYPVQPLGCALSVLCVILSGVGYELWHKSAETTTVSQKSFWMCLPLLIMSSIAIFATTGFKKDVSICLEPDVLWRMLFIGFCTGILYLYANIIPFSPIGRLPSTTACILMQGMTPSAIIGAYFIVGEKLSFSQWMGVLVAMSGATMLSIWVARSSNPEKVPQAA